MFIEEHFDLLKLYLKLSLSETFVIIVRNANLILNGLIIDLMMSDDLYSRKINSLVFKELETVFLGVQKVLFIGGELEEEIESDVLERTDLC